MGADEDDYELDASASALLDAFTTIASDLDTVAVLTRIVESATDLTAASCGALGVLGTEGRFENVITHATDAVPFLEAGAFPADEGLLVPIRVRGTRFGELYLGRGKIDGRRLLDASFVERAVGGS